MHFCVNSESRIWRTTTWTDVAKPEGNLVPTKRRLKRQRVDHRDLDVRAWPFCVRGDAAPSRQQSRDGDQEAHHLCERSWDFLRSEAQRGSRGPRRAAPRSYEPEARRSLSGPETLALAARNS